MEASVAGGLRQSFAHTARQLSGGHSGGCNTGDGCNAPPWAYAMIFGFFALLFLFLAYHRGFFDNMLDKPRPEEDAYNRAGNDPLHIRGCDVPRETAKEFLSALHKQHVMGEDPKRRHAADFVKQQAKIIQKTFAWDLARMDHGSSDKEEKSKKWNTLVERWGFEPEQITDVVDQALVGVEMPPAVVGPSLEEYPVAVVVGQMLEEKAPNAATAPVPVKDAV